MDQVRMDLKHRFDLIVKTFSWKRMEGQVYVSKLRKVKTRIKVHGRKVTKIQSTLR